MLSTTVNCSIGNESNHLTDEQIMQIINDANPKIPIEKYVIKTIKTKADKEEIESFALSRKVNVDYIMEKINGC
jgi:hypothetical protein